MHVVRHDRAGVASIAVLLNRLIQRIGDDGKILRLKIEQRMLQHPACLIAELLNFPS